MTRNKTPSAGPTPVISSGIFRGMKLATPIGDKTRPTSSKARAAALNSVQGWLEGANFCDLFAGSGAVGIEALSRGACECTFAESAPAALVALRRNLAECERRSLAQTQTPPVIRLIVKDIREYLAELQGLANAASIPRNDRRFDIIWADPPYALAAGLLPDLLAFADTHLADGGVLLFETGGPVDRGAVTALNSLSFRSEKKYGGTYITSWQKTSDG